MKNGYAIFCKFFQLLAFILRRTVLKEVTKRGISINNKNIVIIDAISSLFGKDEGFVNSTGK